LRNDRLTEFIILRTFTHIVVALSTPTSIEKPAKGMRNLLGKRNEHEVDSDGVRLTFSHEKNTRNGFFNVINRHISDHRVFQSHTKALGPQMSKEVVILGFFV